MSGRGPRPDFWVYVLRRIETKVAAVRGVFVCREDVFGARTIASVFSQSPTIPLVADIYPMIKDLAICLHTGRASS